MNYIKFGLCAAVLALGMSACSSNEDPTPTPVTPDKPERYPVISIDTLDRIDFNAAEQRTNAALNDFGMKLLNTAISNASDKNENVSVSPLSASLALSMAANCGDSDFEGALLSMFGTDGMENLNSTVNKLMRFLVSRRTGADVVLSNSAWIANTLDARPEWNTLLRNTFYSSVYKVDFTDQSVGQDINEWCSTNTRGLIQSLDVEIGGSTDLVLLNAMYYGADWVVPFDVNDTKKETFNGTRGARKTDMMHRVITTGYVRTDGYQAVTLPMSENEMIFVLPEEGLTPAQTAAVITPAALEKVSCSEWNVTLALPKFTAQGHSGNDVFAAMGVPASTVLEGMGLSLPTGIKVFQDATTSIDETGAKGAAVTVVQMESSPGPGEEIEIKDVTVTFDRPYLFFIRNTRTGTIIMSGVINNID